MLSDEAEFCYKVSDFWHPNDEGGLAWNDPAIGIDWHVRGEYRGSASADGCTLADGTPLNLSEKDQQWLGLKDTFKNIIVGGSCGKRALPPFYFAAAGKIDHQRAEKTQIPNGKQNFA